MSFVYLSTKKLTLFNLIKKMKSVVIVLVLVNMLTVSLGYLVPSRLIQRIMRNSKVKLNRMTILRAYNDKSYPEMSSNKGDKNESEFSTSHIFESEVSSFGINTALAEQHIILGNYEDAKRLAQEAINIGDRT